MGSTKVRKYWISAKTKAPALSLPKPKRISIDAMGGDGGVKVTIPAALNALELNSDLSVTLVGDKTQIEPYLDSISSALADRISINHTLDVISDGDKPAQN